MAKKKETAQSDQFSDELNEIIAKYEAKGIPSGYFPQYVKTRMENEQ